MKVTWEKWAPHKGMGRSNVLEEASRVLAAAFAKQKGLAVSVVGQDPLTAAVGWQNNLIPPGTQTFIGYLLGEDEPATGNFGVATFTMDGIQYAYGSILAKAAPAAGGTDSASVASYAFNVSAAVTWDALVFVVPAGAMAAMTVDWGKGARIVGLKWTDWQALALSAVKVFTAVVTISPKPVPAVISTFLITKT